ncbi:hypothetical protein CLOM_g9311 [Closterium sp. NIES-68]|nr:hypothetical protein CLOM_g9311 [Closterium sp. NIES-68]
MTRDFPLDMKELLPLLDLLSNRVKAVQRLKELLTMKLPPGMVPVKVAIPVVPTVRVSVTFSKFEEFRAAPAPLPEAFALAQEDALWDGERGGGGGAGEKEDHWAIDPFVIPEEYKWIDLKERKRREREKRRRARAAAKAKREGGGKAFGASSSSSSGASAGGGGGAAAGDGGSSGAAAAGSSSSKLAKQADNTLTPPN